MFWFGVIGFLLGAWRLFVYLTIPPTRVRVKVNMRVRVIDLSPVVVFEAKVLGFKADGSVYEKSGAERESECDAINSAFAVYASGGGIVKPLDNWEREGLLEGIF